MFFNTGTKVTLKMSVVKKLTIWTCCMLFLAAGLYAMGTTYQELIR